jgi:hypothetical protein
VLVRHDVPGDGEAIGHDQLGIILRSFKKVAEIDMLLLVLVSLLLPGGDCFPEEHHDMEESVKQEDGIRTNRGGIQEHRAGRSLEGVRQERRLQHDERVRGAFPCEDVAIDSLLVRGGVEILQELGASQVEHELGEDAELSRKAEARRVILPIIRELGTEANQSAIQPSHHISNCGQREEMRRATGEGAAHLPQSQHDEQLIGTSGLSTLVRSKRIQTKCVPAAASWSNDLPRETESLGSECHKPHTVETRRRVRPVAAW